MIQVPTPPVSRSGSEPRTVKPAEDQSELLQSLDVLLEQYLHLLDRQQKLQYGLAKELSSGFLALAHANYTCPPGRRYGADYYDERMKAIRKISIRTEPDEHVTKEKENSENPTQLQTQAPETQYSFALNRIPQRTSVSESQETTETEGNTLSTTEHLQTETPAPSNDGEDAKESSSEENSDDTKSSVKSNAPKKKFHSDDPIHWYGILVPASLRNAQRSFTEATQSQVPELAGVIVEMRSLEQRITKIRKELGVEPLEKTSSP
ncbi:hypothetical protein N7533_000652 [Penicillium manginii]|uniref:uncharacterized protein n=1 Tax=Penicillium manginii TaxID=203109 RepID=UPI0025498675|nr:uncharacterized protein N7533_000652 [Penicillium manginii]KAJ5768069.1 hypothetical protein N7533_000652 [Penicillium manginii]